MDAYVYRAALLCEACALQTRHALRYGEQETVLDLTDSDSWPQGPYADGGGEADTPQHCDLCEDFLENSLTTEGVTYVKQALADNDGSPSILELWRTYYGGAVSEP